MPFAAAISEHPLPTHAIGEAVGDVLERLGEEPTLAALFVTAPHAGALEEMARTVHTVLQPRVLLGAAAVSVLAGSREVEETAAVSLWAARLPGSVKAVRLTAAADRGAGDDEPTWRFEGWPDTAGPLEGGPAERERGDAGLEAAVDANTLLLVPDPFSFPVDVFLRGLRSTQPSLSVIGGLASAAHAPGANRLVLDGAVFDHGAVGVLLDRTAAPLSVVSQGCRPIGEALIVTKARANVIDELGGKPALERLINALERLSPDERERAARGIHVGIVIDEHKLDFERGDFLVRNLLGVDRGSGAVAVGDQVPVGSTVQFHIRDAEAADDDLHAMLSGQRADAALVFTCNGRGSHLFGLPHHDATVVSDVLETHAVAGMFCAGELGPVGGRNFLHGFTASVALFRDP